MILAGAAEVKRFPASSGLPLKRIRGQITQLLETPQSAALNTVVCAEGYVAPGRLGEHTVGASFDFHNEDLTTTPEGHQGNLDLLEEISPDLVQRLGEANLNPQTLQGWAAFRCTSPDYLPIVGPLADPEAFSQAYAVLSKDARQVPDTQCPWLDGLYVNSGLIIYNDEAQTAYLERVQDNLDVFNASSNGAMVLDNELIEGDFRKRALYKLNGSLEHRDVNSEGKVTAKKITAGEAVGVKAPWKYGPYQTTEEAFKRRGRPVEEFSQIVGADVADATLEGFIQYATAGLRAAIGSNAEMVVSANIETDGKKTLTRGMRKFGDKFGRIALWVMHSSAYFDIVDEAITNKIYEEAGVVIYGGLPGTLGKPVLVTG